MLAWLGLVTKRPNCSWGSSLAVRVRVLSATTSEPVAVMTPVAPVELALAEQYSVPRVWTPGTNPKELAADQPASQFSPGAKAPR